MLIIPVKFQSVVFLNATDIKPAGKEILRLINDFAEAGLDMIPSTIAEFNPMGITQRMKFNSQDGKYDLTIGTQRIDFVANSTKLNKDELGTLSDFVSLSRLIFNSLLKENKTKMSRLALVSQYFSEELSPQNINNFLKNIINAPKIDDTEDAPIECASKIGHRRIYKISGRPESFNIISTLGRSTGQMNSPVASNSFDRISAELDVNTIPEATEPRFSLDDWADFSTQALEIEIKLKDQYDSLLAS